MGRLIWLMGPSGSGKDSLLSALRQREHTQLLVAHRFITRAANAGSENHISLSEQEFLPAPDKTYWHSAGMRMASTMVWAWR
jgi:ribose 1,5-bisphosphokinase